MAASGWPPTMPDPVEEWTRHGLRQSQWTAT
jgi:hypothetical protein